MGRMSFTRELKELAEATSDVVVPRVLASEG
jgi:hypothetical protein